MDYIVLSDHRWHQEKKEKCKGIKLSFAGLYAFVLFEKFEKRQYREYKHVKIRYGWDQDNSRTGDDVS